MSFNSKGYLVCKYSSNQQKVPHRFHDIRKGSTPFSLKSKALAAYRNNLCLRPDSYIRLQKENETNQASKLLHSYGKIKSKCKANLSHIPSNSFAGRIHSLKVECCPSPLSSSHGPSSLSWDGNNQLGLNLKCSKKLAQKAHTTATFQENQAPYQYLIVLDYKVKYSSHLSLAHGSKYDEG